MPKLSKPSSNGSSMRFLIIIDGLIERAKDGDVKAAVYLRGGKTAMWELAERT